ncbi:hypothetical protein TNCV_4586661 [Trichonephila clavipes]|nr:hypothetical protein TNCV_4586661 [Trichonephila clavipes]
MILGKSDTLTLLPCHISCMQLEEEVFSELLVQSLKDSFIEDGDSINPNDCGDYVFLALPGVKIGGSAICIWKHLRRGGRTANQEETKGKEAEEQRFMR